MELWARCSSWAQGELVWICYKKYSDTCTLGDEEVSGLVFLAFFMAFPQPVEERTLVPVYVSTKIWKMQHKDVFGIIMLYILVQV